MKFYYADLSSRENNTELHNPFKRNESTTYVDYKNDNAKWNALLNEVQRDDMVIIPSIDLFASDESTFQMKLETVKELGLNLYSSEDKSIDVDLLLKFMIFAYSSRKKKVRELQRVGIEKALMKKQKGEGGFGRPKIEKPKDFESNLEKILNKEFTHETYRNKLGMKRSTYYKFVHEYKEQLNQKKNTTE